MINDNITWFRPVELGSAVTSKAEVWVLVNGAGDESLNILSASEHVGKRAVQDNNKELN